MDMPISPQHEWNNSKSTILGRSSNDIAYDLEPNTRRLVLGMPKGWVDAKAMRKLYQKEQKAAMDFDTDMAKMRYSRQHAGRISNCGQGTP
jgi:hypothetical protein